MIDISSESDALSVENEAAAQNTFYSNVLLDTDGNRIDLDNESMQGRFSEVDNSNSSSNNN